jgi:hypothetical protein
MMAAMAVALADEAPPPASAPAAAPAADAAAPAPKYTGPMIGDILTGSGITFTGYVDGTYTYQHDNTASKDYNTFALQQAAFTLASQPTSGFGALVNVVAGQSPYAATGFASIPPGQGATSTQFYLLQAFVQYVGGPLTLQLGKMATLAGAEVAAPTGNTNTTRSILFAFEPVTHTGIRATWAASDQLSFILGLNNGWTNSQDTSDGSDKTVEAGVAFTPSKALSWTLQGYYGRDSSNYVGPAGPIKANIALLDTVLTWNATSALSLVASVDYGDVQSTSQSPHADWWGVAAYGNYAINDQWRTSLRLEYFDDSDGYLTKNFDPTFAGLDQKLKEITLTFGYDPIKNVEIRLEGRYDDPDTAGGAQLVPKTYQGWVEAIYKF